MYLYLYLCLYLYLYLYQLVPYLIYRFLILYAGTSRESFIHPLPPFLPPGCRLGIYVYMYVPVRLYVRVSPCICPCACTYIQYPQKVHIKRYISKIHIKDTCTRVSWGMWLFLILKIYLPIRSTQKTTRRTSVHPPCLSQTSLGEFYVQAKAKFPFQIGALKRQCA